MEGIKVRKERLKKYFVKLSDGNIFAIFDRNYYEAKVQAYRKFGAKKVVKVWLVGK
jgi:hypothetical protein